MSAENWEHYKRSRNQATSLIGPSKYNFEKNIANQIKANPKQFWKCVGSKPKTRQTVGDLENANGKLSSDNKEKAELLNEYFASAFTVESDEDMPHFTERQVNTVLDNINMTQENILRAFSKLQPNKSPGPDNFHPKLIMETSQELLEPLEIIFINSSSKGTVPTQWKNAL